MTKKRISWLDQFASDYNTQLQKTASMNREAEQIIVDCSAYPNAKVGSLVDFKNHKYKIVDPDYHNEAGPGILLEKLAESDFSSGDPTEDATISNGEVKATAIEEDTKNCGGCFNTKTTEKFTRLARNDEYPSTITEPGGVKPAPSADLETPSSKRVTDPPYHPTYDPGNQYALDNTDTDWEAEAEQTAEVIRQEDAQDRTSAEGYFTWNQNIILDKIVEDVQLTEEFTANDEDDDIVEEEIAENDDIDDDITDVADDEDELAEFDDSKGAENDDIDDEDAADEDVDVVEDEDEDELAEFDDSKGAENDVEDITDEEEPTVEEDEEITDDDTEVTDANDDIEEDFDDLDIEDEDDDTKEDKKVEASLSSTNRIITHLANLL